MPAGIANVSPACGLATGELLAGDLIDAPQRSEAGCLTLPAGPGLGIGLDRAALAGWQIADAVEVADLRQPGDSAAAWGAPQ